MPYLPSRAPIERPATTAFTSRGGNQGQETARLAKARKMGTIQTHPAEATGLLLAWGQGDPGALERLVTLVQHELHRIARRCMAGERVGHSLQATALVNEVYL